MEPVQICSVWTFQRRFATFPEHSLRNQGSVWFTVPRGVGEKNIDPARIRTWHPRVTEEMARVLSLPLGHQLCYYKDHFSFNHLTQLEHVLKRPDTYIGSVEGIQQYMWVYDKDKKAMVNKEISFVSVPIEGFWTGHPFTCQKLTEPDQARLWFDSGHRNPGIISGTTEGRGRLPPGILKSLLVFKKIQL
ncbi:hypothetical protein DFH28DRAFT_925289 [Melampsora americana]|nr:hypothetical protein DFH28DRAFT_925289 [Melampsora americana]